MANYGTSSGSATPSGEILEITGLGLDLGRRAELGYQAWVAPQWGQLTLVETSAVKR